MRAALPLFDRLACRTQSDIEYARRLGCKAELSYLPDPVFSFRATSAKKERLAVCFLHGGRVPKGREIAFYNLRALGYSLVFVPLFEREDAGVCRRYAAHYGALVYVKTAKELCSVLSRAALSISERLHGGIFSLLCHTPSFVLCEDAKSLGLARDAKAYCDERSLLCPILPFSRYAQIPYTGLTFAQDEKETEGEDPFGFSKILEHFRSYWEAGVRL